MVGQVLWKSYNKKRQNFWWLSPPQWVLAIKEVPQWKIFNKLISSPITFVPAVLLLSFEEIHSCHKAYWAVRWEVSLSPSLPVISGYSHTNLSRDWGAKEAQVWPLLPPSSKEAPIHCCVLPALCCGAVGALSRHLPAEQQLQQGVPCVPLLSQRQPRKQFWPVRVSCSSSNTSFKSFLFHFWWWIKSRKWKPLL